MNNPHFLGQTLALIKKNLVVALKRQWISTPLRALVLPLILLILLLEVKSFARDPNVYGIGDPHPFKDVKDSLRDGKPVVIARNSTVGPDFLPVLDRFKKSLGTANVIELGDPDELKFNATCPVDYHGHSPCYALVIFKDSPESGQVNATWEYEIRTDPALQTYGAFNVHNNDGPTQNIILPLQAAIENAIGNLTVTPDVQIFTQYTQAEADKLNSKGYLQLALYTLSFVFFITMCFAGNHLSSMMAKDRATGMSQLIDAMTGNGAAWSRVMSYVLTFDVLYLPLFIIMGALFQALLLPGQNAAILIFWQIFTGWATISASAFGTAFFKSHAFAILWVTLIPILLAVIAAFTENLFEFAPLPQVVVLSLLFPSMNYIYFLSLLVRAEVENITVNLGQVLPKDKFPHDEFGNYYWGCLSGGYFLWIILIVQIIVFPLLAVWVEQFLYGNNRRKRTFECSPEAVSSQTAIQTQGLKKYYNPSLLRKMCCCCSSRKAEVKAVDGLDLTSYRNQVLCLLGPNGSGKTTTLDMLAGFQAPTDGSITLNASPSQIGVCPQKDTLWDDLTVHEHLAIWNSLKGKSDSPEDLERLIKECGLGKKRNSLAGSLSGGMKRKLQLACMLVGGSSVCFADEVTSGLDPLSRRAIWEVILRERSRRTLVLTTHFLDESEVLSDHIVIVTLGKLKCQGSPAQLKNKYGGGYRVHIPKTEDISGIDHPVIERPDRYICRTPDSSSAARLLASLKTSKDSELYITGPTIEDVFLKVAEEPHALVGEAPEDISVAESLTNVSKPELPDLSTRAVYQRQIGALYWKKILLLRSTWWHYLFALAIPIVVSALIGKFVEKYQVPQCDQLIASPSYASSFSSYSEHYLALGPPSLNQTIADIIKASNAENGYDDGGWYYYGSDPNEYGPFVEDSRAQVESFVQTHSANISYGGAIWAGNDDSTPLIAYPAESGNYYGPQILNLLNRALSGVEIKGALGELTAYKPPDGGNSIIWIVIVCIFQGFYPAFFALYTAYEKRTRVRALQYSNGIRPFSIVFAYWTFDGAFVVLVSVVTTVLYSRQTQWFQVGWLFLVQALFGLAATLMSYLVSFISRNQTAAFALSVLFMVIMFVLSIVPLVVLNTGSMINQTALDGTAFGLGLIFPIQNLLRAFTVGLNTYIVRCRGGTAVTYGGSIYAYGGPILLLILQNIWLFILMLWLEGGRIFFFPFSSKLSSPPEEDLEKTRLSGRPDVDAETRRVVTTSSSDNNNTTDDLLLRVEHVSKTFGRDVTALEDVTLGLQKGEILALLGPNGAGKTTALNIIRGDLAPSSGRVYLQNVDVHKNTRLAQQNLGVCPQFDALDLLTVRQQLSFYARCKGVPRQAISPSVIWTMSRVGLLAHADKLSPRLSGGNKRKLSLAIALVGNPDVVLLDEPSSAMDAASKRVLWKTLLESVAPGRSVLLTTHSMEEADALATRAAIVARRLLAVGSTEALRRDHCHEYHVHLVLDAGAGASSEKEMRNVADWVRDTFAFTSTTTTANTTTTGEEGEGGTTGFRFEGENLGGQVRFVVPANSQVPSPNPPTQDQKQQISFTRYLIDTLEANKDRLGLDCYTISAATMESVFLRVVKETDAEEDERVEGDRRGKRSWWWPW
ncbi:hypothetical protein F5Y17DRAFT_460472 [Xylariaceae sp. FL0594]|nr:hypothetical protein F5Y17DRAFT_460472 [Xylariaceae sp. FL0594]